MIKNIKHMPFMMIIAHMSVPLQHLLPLGENLAELCWNSLSHVIRVSGAYLTREASWSLWHTRTFTIWLTVRQCLVIHSLSHTFSCLSLIVTGVNGVFNSFPLWHSKCTKWHCKSCFNLHPNEDVGSSIPGFPKLWNWTRSGSLTDFDCTFVLKLVRW